MKEASMTKPDRIESLRRVDHLHRLASQERPDAPDSEIRYLVSAALRSPAQGLACTVRNRALRTRHKGDHLRSLVMLATAAAVWAANR